MDEYNEISGVKIGQMVAAFMWDEGIHPTALRGKYRSCHRYMMRRVRKMAKTQDASPGKAPRYSYDRAAKAIPDLLCDFMDAWDKREWEQD